jgi:TRAP-type C4-dicarboxylate transport system permease small subunit
MQMKQRVEAVIDRLIGGVDTILAIVLLGAICLNCANVVGRYLADVSITGSDEIEIYCLIAMAFIGSISVTWRGMHLRMDILVEQLPVGFRKAVSVIETLVAASVLGFVAYQSYFYASRVYRLGAVSDIAHLPTWIPHSVVPLSLSLMALLVVMRICIQRSDRRGS